MLATTQLPASFGVEVDLDIGRSVHAPQAAELTALVAGAEVVHATALGIGERVGNTQLDQMLVNLKLLGIEPWKSQDLTKLKEMCDVVSNPGTMLLQNSILAGAVLSRYPWRSVDGYIGHAWGVQLLALISVGALAASVVPQAHRPT